MFLVILTYTQMPYVSFNHVRNTTVLYMQYFSYIVHLGNILVTKIAAN